MDDVLSFLNAYPFPAWICNSLPTSGGRKGFELDPEWSNTAFDKLLGPRDMLLASLDGGEAIVRYGTWLEASDINTFAVSLQIFWEEEDSTQAGGKITVELELARTIFTTHDGGLFIICTSVPRSKLPTGINTARYMEKGSRKRKKKAFKLHDFPHPIGGSRPISNPTSSTSGSISTGEHLPSMLGGRFGLAEMVARFPWDTSPLGPQKDWDPCLKQAVQLTLTAPYPTATWWGPDLVLIYNDAYAEIAGSKHPRIFGQKGLEAWDELWATLGPALRSCMDGHPVYKKDDLLLMDRLESEDQPLEETYHSWSWTPILGADGSFNGVFNGTHETTSKVLAERRLITLQLLGNRAAIAQNRETFCQAVLSAMEENDKDIPFVALYITEASTKLKESDESSATPQIAGAPHLYPVPSLVSMKLGGAVGVEGDHPAFPPYIEVKINGYASSMASADEDSFMWPFEQAIQGRDPVRVVLPRSISDGIQRRGWGDRVTQAMVIPISSEGDAQPLGAFILGLNTRRALDVDYVKWIDVMRSSVNALLTASIAREEEVRRADHLIELDRAKSSLLSSVSHELRTPLTLIGGPLSDAILEEQNPTIKNKLQTAARNVDRLARLVDSLMDFSRLEAGRLEGRYSPILFGPYVADLASVFRPVIEKAGLGFTVSYDEQETRALFIDQDYMEKIIFNLIGNAFKYTMNGEIFVSVVYRDHDVQLVVRDTGVGIPESDIDRIWERFHRVEATSRSHEGTGIGLSLTKQFVTLHGGTITVTSKIQRKSSSDHGSTFVATFPLGSDHLPAARLVEAGMSGNVRRYARGIVAEAARWRLAGDAVTPSDSDESYTSSDGTKITEFAFEPSDLIIIVDDNQDMLEYIRGIISRYCHIRTASNGQEALVIARKHPPALIISDVMMPIMDGFALVEAIREDPILRLTPIILLTARAADTNRAEGVLSGADDYMPKPFSSKELVARASLQIQLGKRRIELETGFQERTKEVQLLSDLSPSGLFRIDKSGHMLLCNKRYLELSSMQPGEEIDWLRFVHEDYRKKVEETFKESLNTHQDTQVDFVFANGNWVKGMVRCWDFGLVGTITDMSMTRLYEESLTKRAEEAEERRIEAEERRRSQELLVDVTSHELRQPVSAVINCASVVAANLQRTRSVLADCLAHGHSFKVTPELLKQVDEDLESLNAIELCGLAQGHIVNDILTLSRMQLRMLNLQDSTFPLVKEIHQVLSILFNEMKSKGITHKLTFGPSFQNLAVNYVTVDKVRFGQVIINLLSNAIRFSQSSAAKTIDITVDVSRHPPSDDSCRCPVDFPDDMIKFSDEEKTIVYVYLSVRDSGPGLKPKDLEILFQRFQKGTNSEETFGGSGLGLFVSRKICDLLGGRIEVDASSVGNRGSTFRFYVQMKTDRPPLQISETAPATPIASQVPLRVLIAEDNLINRRILDRQLKSNNCVTSLAVNGAEAVELVISAGAEAFDCILMDCEMPVMSGLAATKELRRLELEGQIPSQRIIALTGNARREQIENALQAGMDEVMTKPYRLEELLERMRVRSSGVNHS